MYSVSLRLIDHIQLVKDWTIGGDLGTGSLGLSIEGEVCDPYINHNTWDILSLVFSPLSF